MKEVIYNGSVQKLPKPEGERPSDRIEFKNGSVIECLKTNSDTTRGYRSKIIYPDRSKCIQDYIPEIECELFDINLKDICKECWDRNW